VEARERGRVGRRVIALAADTDEAQRAPERDVVVRAREADGDGDEAASASPG
jgi:RNase P protein component